MVESKITLHHTTILRNKRKDHLYEFVKENGTKFERIELIARYSNQTGSTARTVNQYLEEYIATGTLVWHGNHVVTVIQDHLLDKEEFKRLKELSESRSDN